MTQCLNEKEITDACVFSPISIDDEIIDKLRFAQRVIESQWLAIYNPTACFVVLCGDDVFTEYDTRLYNDVWLIDKENWQDVIDSADYILVNDLMFNLCKDQDATYINLSIFDSEKLQELFEGHMFVVAGVS